MATHNYFSHTSRDGRTFDQRIAAAGYRNSSIGENLAWGQSSVASVMSSWLNSAGHCANIMNATWKDIGAAAVRDSSGRIYWVMTTGAPS